MWILTQDETTLVDVIQVRIAEGSSPASGQNCWLLIGETATGDNVLLGKYGDRERTLKEMRALFWSLVAPVPRWAVRPDTTVPSENGENRDRDCHEA